MAGLILGGLGVKHIYHSLKLAKRMKTPVIVYANSCDGLTLLRLRDLSRSRLFFTFFFCGTMHANNNWQFGTSSPADPIPVLQTDIWSFQFN